MIPLMMERGYRPTGWLGLLLGTRLYFNFHPAAVETDAAFSKQMDAVERELGGRGHPEASSGGRVSEGVPPGVASSWSLEPSPSPAPAPAPAPAASTVVEHSGFSPSMQLSSPAPVVVQQRSTTEDASLVVLLLEREERMRQEAKAERVEQEAKVEKLRQETEAKAAAEKAELRQEMQQQMEKMREEIEEKLTPAEAISEQRLASLQARLEALHAAKLLGDDELYALEDMMADYLELKATMGIVTGEMVNTSASTSKLLKVVGLSEGVAADGAFARQVRRKYV
eukprot:SAG11_NODE_2332_length_3506_cov_2.301732_1_plen_283_part_00